jgi:hypothetical protein
MTTKTTTFKKKKISIVTWYNCLRCIKLTIGLWLQKAKYNKEYEIELITRPEGYSLVMEMGFVHMYKLGVKVYENTSQLADHIKNSQADVFWCHNEPDVMAQLSIHFHRKKRLVIHDCHDLPSLHYEQKQCPSCKTVSQRIMNEFIPQETIVCKGSDYVFVPTPDYVTKINKLYDKPIDKILQVNSCSPSTFFPDVALPRVGGFLYCGQVNVPEMNSKLHYRDCLPLFRHLTMMGIPSHIYSTTPNANLEPYLLEGACLHGTLKMFSAMAQYTRYDYGFTGSNVDTQEIQICMPNKLWDCLASGIPIIALNAKTAGEFIVKNNFGVNIQGLANLSKVPWIKEKDGQLLNWDFWQEKRKAVLEARYEFTAEKEVRKAFDKIGI